MITDVKDNHAYQPGNAISLKIIAKCIGNTKLIGDANHSCKKKYIKNGKPF